MVEGWIEVDGNFVVDFLGDGWLYGDYLYFVIGVVGVVYEVVFVIVDDVVGYVDV